MDINSCSQKHSLFEGYLFLLLYRILFPSFDIVSTIIPPVVGKLGRKFSIKIVYSLFLRKRKPIKKEANFKARRAYDAIFLNSTSTP